MEEKFTSRPGAAGRLARLICRVLCRLYAVIDSDKLQTLIRGWVARLEGGPAISSTLRQIYRKHHGVEVAPFTTGPFVIRPKHLHRGTSFGRYVSVAETVRTFTRHHPRDTRSTHGVFYNPALGRVKAPSLKHNGLHIGHGAWIGPNVIILHPAKSIGEGAIVAPGSVVYTDVPAYAKVSGNPAMVSGYRFPKETIAQLLASKWWEQPPTALASLPRSADLHD